MKLYNAGIQKRLVVAVQCQMALIAPVCQLVDDGTVQTVLDLHEGTLLCMNICRAERAGGIAAVDGFDVYHLRHRSLILLHKPLDVLILNRSSCHKLKLQISTARQIGGNASCFKSEFSKKTADTNTHKNLLLRNQSTSTVFSSTAS